VVEGVDVVLLRLVALDAADALGGMGAPFPMVDDARRALGVALDALWLLAGTTTWRATSPTSSRLRMISIHCTNKSETRNAPPRMAIMNCLDLRVMANHTFN
jgi:hypothetical protein